MLNTLKTNLILTRAVLIALFAGLFILAACGGGGGAAAPTTATPPAANPCDTNPFGTTCTRAADIAARSLAITNCATSYNTRASKFDCDFVPQAVVYCLRDPLATSGTTACDATAYDTARQGSGVTISEVRSTRVILCRDDSNRNETLCNSTVVQNCGDDANPFDLVCGRLNPARNAIIEICVDSATLADSTKNADCVAARTAGFTCFDNPWAESCVTSTMYREFASFRADAQESRLEYCMDDDADSGVCGSALARVCSASGDGANPFSDLCTGANNTYDSVRADFATNCFNRKATDNDVTDCTVTAFEVPRTGDAMTCGDGTPGNLGTTPNDPTCMTTPVTVATCANAPFSTNCKGVDTFAGVRSALLEICTNGVADANDFFCGTNGGFSNDEAACIDNPFTPDVTDGINCGTLFTALGDTNTLKTAQDNLIAGCTGADADGMNTRCESGVAGAEVSTCLANPFETNCDMILGSETQATTAQSNLIALCTGTDASVATNTLCTGIPDGANNVKTCIDNPFFTSVGNEVRCTVALGSAEAVTLAQSNLIEVCTGADADGSNARCTVTGDTELTGCLDDPFSTGCDTELGDGAMTAQSNVLALCVGDAITTNALCMGLGGNVKTCLDNPFTTSCDTTLGGETQATAAQDNLIDVCTGADADGSNPRCAILNVVDVTTCLANPFETNCDMILGSETQATTAQNNIIALCTTADSDNFNTNSVCTNIPAGNVKTCLDNPFTTGGAVNCAEVLGDTDAVTRAQANLNTLCFGDTPDTALCTPELKTSQFCSATADGANPFNVNCDAVDGIDAGARTTFCTATANSANDNCTTDANTLRTTCSANPFAEACFVADSGYADNRERAVDACNGVVGDKTMDALCRDVVVRAAGSDPATDPAVTLASCFAEPFQSACADDAFDTVKAGVRFSCGGGDQPSCDIVVGQDSDGMNVTVAMCDTDPLNSACADKSFDTRRNTRVGACLNALPSARDATTECDDEVKAMVPAEGNNPMIPAVTVKDCIDSPFSADCTNGAFDNARTESYTACNGDDMHAACDYVIIAEDTTNGVTLVNVGTCTGDPFASGCETLDTFAGARCTAQPFNTECLGNDVYDTARCTANPFYMDCATDTALDDARDDVCTSPSASNYNVFNVNCTEDDYTGTDAARKTIADGCRAGTTTTGCDAVVSDATGAPTITMCNTNPYATGCDATVFADALTAYCADGAATIFDTNCDSRTDIATARSVAIGECVAVLTTDKTAASCTGREIVAGEEEVTAIIEGTTMVDHDNNPDTPDIVARAEDARDGVPAVPAVTVGVCLDDPFHTSCASDLFDEFRADHMEVCMSNGNANLPSCTNINTSDITYQTCLRNPFDTACTTSASGHRFRNARAARYAFCEGSRAGSAASVASGDTDLCGSQGAGETGTTIRGEICSYGGGDEGERLNPFAGVCAANTYVSSKKYYCGVGGRRASDANCNDIVADNSINTADGCLANPFSDTCTADLPSTGATITEELRTFLTMQRTTYCTAVDAEGFDETLCQTTDTNDADFASTVCQGQTADANPFAPFCVRDGNTFDADRVTFVQACAALATGTTLAGGATCTQAIIDCNTNAYGADCVNENAYASVRQTVVTNCVTAFNAGTHANNADCTTIMGVGQLTCITTNPYLNRPAVDAVAETTPGAGDGTDAVIGLNCAGNSNYDMVRETLESDCAGSGDSATGADRCPVLLAGVCGSGTTTGGDAVAGTNPFNADFCTGTDNVYAAHRKAVIDSCDGTTVTTSCTAEINACINNPFLVDGITTGDNSVDCDDASVVAAFVNPTITYCGTGSTSDTANISLEKCQMFATSNTCVANPFGSTCDNAMLGGATDALTTARSLRTTYCSGLGTSSATIRGDSTSAYCLGAAENFCKGDNLFASTPGAGVFDCLSDTGGTYTADRATHAGLCANVASDDRTTAGTDCTNAMVEICTTTDGLQTNPWSSICSEDNADPTAAQITVINACLAKSEGTAAGERGEVADTNVCTRTIDDSGSPVPNNDVVEILATCTGDARDAACDDYAEETGEPFTTARVGLYVSGCAGDSPDAALCPAAKVQPVICVTNGDNSRPFAEICETGVTDIETYKEEVLTYCLSVASAGNQRCVDGTAPTTKSAVDLVKTACGGSAPTNNPFNGAVSVTGVIGTLDCNTYNFFDNDRNTYATQCRNSITGYNCVGNTGALALICNASTGSAANPFSALCLTPHAQSRLAFATLCVGKTAGVAIDSGSNLATCPAEVIACANRPFGSLCTDAGYNAEKATVLGACNTGQKITDNADGRCNTAVTDLTCLSDPFATCAAPDTYLPATGYSTGALYVAAIREERLIYCSQGDNVKSKNTICRSATGNNFWSWCLVNPFAGGCDDLLGGDGSVTANTFKANRLKYCLGNVSAENATAARANLIKRVSAAAATETESRATPTATGANLRLCDKAGGETTAISEICIGSVGDNNTPSDADGDKTKDPFTEFCRAFTGTNYTTYDARRLERIGECAGFSNPAATGTTSCNWAAQVTHCANTDAALNAQCGDINTVLKWSDAVTTTVSFTNSVGTANAFIDDLANTSDPIDFSSHATLEVNPNLAGRRIEDAVLPNVRFYSARTKAVEEVIGVTEVLVDSTLDGMEVTLADSTVIASVDSTHYGMEITVGVDAVAPVPAGVPRFFAGIELSSGTVGRPVFNRGVNDPTATWTGTIDWIGVHNAANSNSQPRAFNMLVNFADRTLQGAVPTTVGAIINGDHIVIDAQYSAAGIISGTSGGGVTLRRYATDPNASGVVNIGAALTSGVLAYRPGTVTGIIGHLGAVGVFINDSHTSLENAAYGGGFIVKPPSN